MDNGREREEYSGHELRESPLVSIVPDVGPAFSPGFHQ